VKPRAFEEGNDRSAGDEPHRDRGHQSGPSKRWRDRKDGDRGEREGGHNRHLDSGPLQKQRVVNKGDLNKADHLAVEKRPEAPAVDQDIGAYEDEADTHAEQEDQLVSPES